MPNVYTCLLLLKYNNLRRREKSREKREYTKKRRRIQGKRKEKRGLTSPAFRRQARAESRTPHLGAVKGKKREITKRKRLR